MLTALGQSVRRYRLRSGRSMEVAADFAGVTAETIARIERGENTTLATLLKVSQSLDCYLQITIQRVPPDDSPRYIGEATRHNVAN
jgi:transcriptional regulator with XRE-family HTH domain